MEGVKSLFLRATVAGALVVLTACASGPKKAEDSAIALAKSVVMESVPLGGMAVQALFSAGDGKDLGSYKYKSQYFCQTNSQALANIRTNFAQLCGRKGALFDGQFCTRPEGTDQVLFSAQLETQGTGRCYTLYVSEAVAVGSADYMQFLVSKAGYETAEVKAGNRAVVDAAAAQARAKAQAVRQAREAREMARLETELPLMRKRGARVCMVESGKMFVYRGYVEDFTDEKLKIAVAEAFLPNSPGTQPSDFRPNTLWDYPIRWRIC
jgi:hypothetical protein